MSGLCRSPPWKIVYLPSRTTVGSRVQVEMVEVSRVKPRYEMSEEIQMIRPNFASRELQPDDHGTYSTFRLRLNPEITFQSARRSDQSSVRHSQEKQRLCQKETTRFFVQKMILRLPTRDFFPSDPPSLPYLGHPWHQTLAIRVKVFRSVGC